jgi:hypothetical protein
MDKEGRQNFEASQGAVSDGFDQEHIGLLAWFWIDELDALGSQLVAA